MIRNLLSACGEAFHLLLLLGRQEKAEKKNQVPDEVSARSRRQGIKDQVVYVENNFQGHLQHFSVNECPKAYCCISNARDGKKAKRRAAFKISSVTLTV